MTPVRARLVPLFLVSGAAVGLETALTRYFAVAKWSEYGYWVISIVMVGFAFSGVTMALARGPAVRHARVLLAWLPVALVVTAAAGFWGVTANPFNPLQLQNAATYGPQIWNIALYYAVLLPFFYLTGLYISLCFVLNDDRIGQVYGADLLGAGAGSALVLALMFAVHPFLLVPVLLVPLAAATLFGPAKPAAMAGLAALLVCEAGLYAGNQAAFNDFKAIYAPLHVPDSRVLAEITSPRGLYTLLDDFTERVDTDVTNDMGLLNVPGPPQTYGLYRDGNRISALPKPGLPPGSIDVRYAPATLAALPYTLRPGATVLLAGSSGGFRIAEALALGARHVTALEPDPVVMGALRHGLGGSPPLGADGRVTLSPDGPLAAARAGAGFDLVDLSGDFLDEAEANSTAFTADSLAADLAAVSDGGIVSVPVSIREFPVYALRVLATARQALLAAGVSDPARHAIVYRSAWNVRILLSRQPWSAERIAAVRGWCDARSFDVSYFPGMDLAASRAGIYNDLPAVSFEDGSVTSGEGSQDSIADEAAAVLRGEPTPSADAFSLRPATLDRPAFYDVLLLTHLGTVLRRLEILPQAEIGQLVNLAVLAQAAAIALLVLLVPVLAGKRLRAAGGAIVRPVVYFACLGLGFLFIEIAMIERASLFLNDRTAAFALVLTAMLVFSGLGSLLADRVGPGGIALSTGIAVLWCLAAYAGLLPAMLATLDWPWLVRAGLVVLAVAPVSVALGMPFPLGLQRTGMGAMLPFAWAVNGAFSVVATPLANILATQGGLRWVLLGAALLYVICFAAYPSFRKRVQWQPSPTT